MTQSQIDHSVSRATGESVRENSRRGFSLAAWIEVDDPESDESPQVVDWEALDEQRPSLFPQRS